MWIFLNDSMLSIVAHRERKDCLLVRARLRGDIEANFPKAEVWEDNQADYRWRAVVTREEVSRVLFEQAYRIDYTNFKGSVKERERHDWYMRVWTEGHRMQDVEKLDERCRPALKQRARKPRKAAPRGAVPAPPQR